MNQRQKGSEVFGASPLPTGDGAVQTDLTTNAAVDDLRRRSSRSRMAHQGTPNLRFFRAG